MVVELVQVTSVYFETDRDYISNYRLLTLRGAGDRAGASYTQRIVN